MVTINTGVYSISGIRKASRSEEERIMKENENRLDKFKDEAKLLPMVKGKIVIETETTIKMVVTVEEMDGELRPRTKIFIKDPNEYETLLKAAHRAYDSFIESGKLSEKASSHSIGALVLNK